MFTMMVGIPGSGKSTVAKYLSESKNAVIFSSDEYRERVFGDVNDQSHNSEVFEILHKDMIESLSAGKNCIFDATNVHRKYRMQLIDEIKSIKGEKHKLVCYVVNTHFSKCVERDSKRDRVCGENVLRHFMENFECPQYFEGWDEIKFTNDCDSCTLEYKIEMLEDRERILDEMHEFDQQNPHHIYALGEHCARVAAKYEKGSFYYEAGLFHDIGKLFTRTVDENGIAHYKYHANVGAYYLISHPGFLKVKDPDDYLFTIFLINYHMLAHEIKTYKAEKKFRNIFGNSWFERLMNFAENDRIATGTSYE